MEYTRRRAGGRLLAAAASLAPIAGCDAADSVVVGVATSPTFADAARLALEDALAAAPIRGLDTVMVAQGGNQAPPAIGVAESFVADGRTIGVVGHSNSAASIAAAPIYNDGEIVQVAPTSTAVPYSDAGPFSFRLVPPDDRQGPFLAGHLETLFPDGGTLAVFYVNDDYGRGLRAAFREALEGRGLQVMVELPHTETDVLAGDLEQARRSLGEARPDAVVWLGRGTILDRYLPVIRAAVPDAPVVGGDATYSILQSAGDDELRRGVTFVGFVDLDASERLRTFAARYRERFDRPATGPDVLHYDAMSLLLDGIRSGARTGPELRDHLRSLGRGRPPFQALSGPLRFDERGDVERSYVMVTYDRTPTP